MKDDFARCTLRIDRELFSKFRYVCGSHGRSINNMMTQMIKKIVSDYEKKNGEINLSDIDK